MMVKFWSLSLALEAASMLLIVPKAFSLPLTLASGFSPVPSTEIELPVCYMQTDNGTLVDLSSLCGMSDSKVVISEVSFQNDRLIGRVVNKTDKTVYSTRVNYEILDDDGGVIGTSSMYTNPPNLSAGESATFETEMWGGRELKTTSVDWDRKPTP